MKPEMHDGTRQPPMKSGLRDLMQSLGELWMKDRVDAWVQSCNSMMTLGYDLKGCICQAPGVGSNDSPSLYDGGVDVGKPC